MEKQTKNTTMNPTQEKIAREVVEKVKAQCAVFSTDIGSKIFVAALEAITTATSELEKENKRQAEILSKIWHWIDKNRPDSAINKAMPDFKSVMGSECDHAEVAINKLVSDLESARKQISEMRDAVRAIPELNLGNYTDDDIRALQDSVLEADRICQSSTGSNYVSVEHPVIVELYNIIDERTACSNDPDCQCRSRLALAAFQKLKGESK